MFNLPNPGSNPANPFYYRTIEEQRRALQEAVTVELQFKKDADGKKKRKKRKRRRTKKRKKRKRRRTKKRKRKKTKRRMRTRRKRKRNKRRKKTKKKRKRKSRKKRKRKKSRKRKSKRSSKKKSQSRSQSKIPLSQIHLHPINLQVFRVSLTIHKKRNSWISLRILPLQKWRRQSIQLS
jgi:hypothetical protein